VIGPTGWFPDPHGQPGQRYFDGQRWTEHFTPSPPPPPPVSVVVNNNIATPAPSVAVAVSGGGTNHALHLVLTVLSCGMWLPIWILIAIFDSVGRPSASVAVDGSGGTRVSTRRPGTPLIVGAVFLALVILGQALAHPWLFVPIFLLAGAGGAFFWKQKVAKDAQNLEVLESYRRDVLAHRADTENKLAQEGDPRGTYGNFPPPPWRPSI